MLRLLSVSVMCLGLLSACATTEKLINKVNVGSSDSPLQQVLTAHPALKKASSNIEIRQVFNRVESPTAAQVIVTQTGLMDDSVRAIRTVYRFKYVKQDWALQDTQKNYQCMRGQNTRTFQTAMCP